MQLVSVMFIRRIVIYPVDSAIQRLNNRALTQCLVGWLTEWRTDIDCKTVRIFAYSSTREQSNKRSGTGLKTESETGERCWKYFSSRLTRFACVRLLRHTLPISLLILRKKPTVLQSRTDMAGLLSYCLQLAHSRTDDHWSDLLITHSL